MRHAASTTTSRVLRLTLVAIASWLLLAGCVSGRSVEEALELMPSNAPSWPSRLEPAALQAAVMRAADQMELDVERESLRVGDPWVFRRGIRLVDPALWWVIIIKPNPDKPGHSIIAVHGVPEYRVYATTGETMSKGGELAMRITVTAMEATR